MEDAPARIALTTFSATSLHRFAGTDIDEILSKIDRDANTFIHVVHASPALSSRILEHFSLARPVAEHSGDETLELDTSADRYALKRFRFIEQAVTPQAVSRAPSTESFLIRGSETERFTEGSGSIIVGEQFVLLFEDRQPSPLLAKTIEDIAQRERELRQQGIDFLLYRLAKGVFVDNYFKLMRELLDRLQDLEARLLEGSTDAPTYRTVVRLRRELNPFERSLLYMADFIATVAAERAAVRRGLSASASTLANDRDRLEKEFSMLRERTSELIQTYRDNVNAQLNNTMRSLTVLSALFLPLTFITGFYGMNFPGMPTLNWSGTFPIVIALMVAIVAGSLVYARRQNWL